MANVSLVIVGGGFIGAGLAKSLEDVFDVTLIEPRDAFVHAPAMVRALVDSTVRDQTLIPYDRLLERGWLVKSRATEIRPDAVVTAEGEKIAADYIVLAPGGVQWRHLQAGGREHRGLQGGPASRGTADQGR